MASEPSEGRPISVVVPPSLEEWLSERAEGSGMEREELLVTLLAAYKQATTEGAADVDSLVDGRVGPIVTQRLDQFDEDVERKLDDIRRRVVQLKRETDEKVPEDQFESLGAQVDELGEQVREMRVDIDAIDPETVADHDERLDDVEGSLHDQAETAVRLDERLDDVESKLTRVARAVVALRRERDATDGEESAPTPALAASADATLVDIKRQAAREHIGSADCGACGASVDLSLLPEAACPHCEASFGGLEGRDGMFSSPRLVGEGGGSDA